MPYSQSVNTSSKPLRLPMKTKIRIPQLGPQSNGVALHLNRECPPIWTSLSNSNPTTLDSSQSLVFYGKKCHRTPKIVIGIFTRDTVAQKEPERKRENASGDGADADDGLLAHVAHVDAFVADEQDGARHDHRVETDDHDHEGHGGEGEDGGWLDRCNARTRHHRQGTSSANVRQNIHNIKTGLLCDCFRGSQSCYTKRNSS